MSSPVNSSGEKALLLKRYPNFIRDKGADLDGNGKIDANERFGDLNGNGTVGDDEDFRLYYLRNMVAPVKEIGIANGVQKAPFGNLIQSVFAIESEVVPEATIKKANEILSIIFEKIESRADTLSAKSPEEKLRSIYDILINEVGIKFRGQKNDQFSENISRSVVDCDTLSILFLAIAEKFSWPLYGVRAPNHFFVRWEEPKVSFNFDHGFIYKDEHYISFFNILKGSMDSGFYLKSLSKKELFSYIYTLRGIPKVQSGDLKGALKDCDEALRLDPNNASAYINRGIIMTRLEDFKGAIKELDEGIRLDPGSIEAYVGRGDAKLMLKDLRGTISDCDEAVRLFIDINEAIRRDGNINQDIGIDKNIAIAYYNRGLAKCWLGDLNGALIDLNEAIRLDKNSATLYRNRGLVKMGLKDLRGAIKDFDKAIRLDPNDGFAYFNRGTAKLQSDDPAGALKDLDIAIQLYRNSSFAFNNRGLAKSRLGDLRGAIKDYDEAIRLDRKNASPYNNRGIAREKLGDKEGAKKDYETADRLTQNPH